MDSKKEWVKNNPNYHKKWREKIKLWKDEFYNLCHYTNLQPLWGEDNIRKGNKIL